MQLQVVLAFLCVSFSCLGQLVTLPQCPEYADTYQVSASCISSVTDLAFDASGTGWIADGTLKRVLRFPGIKVGQVPTSNQTADLVIGKADFETPTNGSCQLCALYDPVQLAFDSSGALWVADQNGPSIIGSPPMLHRFSPPFSNGQPADLIIPGPWGGGGMVFDTTGNLWTASPYSCGSVLEYSTPFSANIQPTIVLGQTSATSCITAPGPNVLNGVQGLAFGPDGSLFVGDHASNRIAIFKPPFQTFMNASIVIGQPNLTSFESVPFDQGGLSDIRDVAIDPAGKLWVLSNNYQYVSVYSPPFSTGMARDSWFNVITGQTSNGTPFPYLFQGFSLLRFVGDSSLWFANGIGTLAVLSPSVLQLLTLSPSVSFIGSAATGTSPFAAGQLISIYGTQLGPASGSGLQLGPGDVVTNSNSGTQVLFDGTAAPIIYTSATQVNAAIPCAVAGQSSTQMVIEYMGAQSAPLTVALSPSAPGIFTADGSGQGQAAALNQDNSFNSPSNPAPRGSIVTFYATGVGPTSPCVDGQVYQSNFPTIPLPVVVGVGSSGAHVDYAGQAPDLVSGVAQFNIEIPSDATTGVVPLTLVVGGVFSRPGVTIAVK